MDREESRSFAISNATRPIYETTKQMEELLYEMKRYLHSKIAASDAITSEYLPPRESNLVTAFTDGIRTLQQALESLNDEIWLHHRKFLSGRAVTKSEYYTLLADGILRSVVPYEKFIMLHYEDDKRQGYIDSTDPVPRGMVRIGGIGNEIKPEDVRVEYLRPEQAEFFRTKMPKVYARFKSKPLRKKG